MPISERTCARARPLTGCSCARRRDRDAFHDDAALARRLEKARQRSNVVLPEPDGPTTQTTSFGCNRETDVPQHFGRAEAFRYLSEAINGAAKSRPRRGTSTKKF